MSFKIITDTSGNLTQEIIDKYNLTVIPFSFYFNGEEHTDLQAENFDAVSFFNMMRSGVRVSTSQITPQQYIDCFRWFLEEEQDILYVGMSSGISGTFNSSVLAAKELKDEFPLRKIRVFDTMTASLGEGLQVIRACELREEGLDIDETYAVLLGERPKVSSIFTVDDLSYILSTGRLFGAAKRITSLIKIKPILKGNEVGHIVLNGVLPGRKRAILSLAERYNHNVVDPEKQLVGVAHCDCEEDADLLIRLISEKKPPREILKVFYEPVTGSHIGPGSLALFFHGAEDVRLK